MKKLKKIALIFLSVLMVIQCAGCGNNEKKTSGIQAENKDTFLTDEYIEFDIFLEKSEDEDGQWKVFKEAARMTNVGLNCTLSRNHSGFASAFNMMIASGDLPDLTWVKDYLLVAKYAKQGAFVALDEYLDECAPNISKYLEENPEIRKRITMDDGHIYYMPTIPGGYARYGYFIRQDWLDKLGLDNPDSPEAFYEVLKAFKTKDPNGNGKADEVPYLGSTESLNGLLTFWGSNPGWYSENGEVKYGPFEPEYKEALKNIRKWYKEGLIDPEIFTRANALDVLFGNNTGGACRGMIGSTAGLNDKFADNIPGFELTPMAPPSGVELTHRNKTNPWGWAITTSCKDVETAVKYFDFWFSEAGNHLINFGVEGEFYDLVDGEAVFKQEAVSQPDFRTKLTSTGAQKSIGYVQDFKYEEQWINQIAKDGFKLYEEGGYIKEIFPPVENTYSEDELEEYQKINGSITTHVSEYYQKTILGSNEDVEKTYDKYIKELKSLGIDRLIELQQIAFDRYNKR